MNDGSGVENLAKYRVTCVNDEEVTRFGFLWLKKKKQKLEDLTKGKDYPVLQREERTYGYGSGHSVFSYFIVVNDNGIPQYYPIARFSFKVKIL
jgi:hypothetical protein